MAEPYDDEAVNPDLLATLEQVNPDLLATLEPAERVDPATTARQVSQYAVDPSLTPERIEEMGELTDIGMMLEGRQPDVAPEVEALGLAPVSRAITGAGEKFSQAALNAVTTDPMELADILTSRFPDDIEVRLSPEGVPVATNKHAEMLVRQKVENGDIEPEEAEAELAKYTVAINRPGLSGMDVYQSLGLVGMYSPAGRFATAPFKGVSSGLTGAAKEEAKRQATRSAAGRALAGEGATEIGLQQVQEAFGGKMDPGEVAFTMLTAPIPEIVATPLTNLGRKTYEIAKDKVDIPDGIRKGIEYAREHGRKIATSDALADIMTAPRRIFLRAADRIPVIGTSKMRLRQGAERADTMEHLFSHYGISGENNFAEYIANNFNQQQARKFAEYAGLRASAFEALAGGGNVQPKKFMNMIADEMERVAKMEPDAARRPRNWLASVYKDFDGLENFTFRDADAFLNSLMDGAAKGDALSEMKRNLANKLTEDMAAHAKAVDIDAFNQWDLARALGLKEMDRVHNQALKQALKNGDITPDLVDTVLNKGRGTDLTTMYRNLNATGKQLVRSRVMAQALRKAGASLDNLSEWASSTNNINNLIRVLDKDPVVQRGIRRFFNDEDKAVLEGAKEYLRMTSESGKQFEAIGMMAGGQGGQGAMKSGLQALNPWNWATTTAAKAHESDFVRDMLLRLRNTTDTPLVQRQIYSELRPVLLGLSQASAQDGRDPFAAEEEPTMFERFVGGTGLAGKQLVESVGEFAEPAWDASMEYLRSVTGLGGEEENASGP